MHIVILIVIILIMVLIKIFSKEIYNSGNRHDDSGMVFFHDEDDNCDSYYDFD